MIKLRYLLFIYIFLFLACKKEQLLYTDNSKTIKLDLKGYIMTDTLEFIKGEKVIFTGIDAFRTSILLSLSDNDKIKIRKKTDKKIINEFTISQEPFSQVKKFFYDGNTLADNIELTKVSDTTNMGFRMRFATTHKDFYGGPVDIELFIYLYDQITNEYSYTSLQTIQNVTGSFSKFIELPPLISTDTITKLYLFKVYKAGTKELPYNVEIPDPEYNYGYLDNYSAGSTQLLSISPVFNSDTGQIGSGYGIVDFSAPFK
jgi:hypothetical protein